MKKDSSLINYDEYNNYEEFKKILLYSLIVFSFFVIGFVILSTFIKSTYPILVSYIVGSVVSVLLFYIISKYINQNSYDFYKKVIKRIHTIHQIAYILVFALLVVIYKHYYAVIGATLGLLLIRISIVLSMAKQK